MATISNSLASQKVHFTTTEQSYIFCEILRTTSCYFPKTALTAWSLRQTKNSPCGTKWSIIYYMKYLLERPCHGSGGESPPSHCRGPNSIPGHAVQDFWCTKWHWDRFFEWFRFPLSVSIQQRCSLSSSACCSYQKDMRAMYGYLPKSKAL